MKSIIRIEVARGLRASRGQRLKRIESTDVGGEEVVGQLPGLVPNRKWIKRLLDLYDLAHHQAVYCVELNDVVLASIKAKAHVSWNQINRLVTFARSIGIGMAVEKDGGESHKITLKFWDAAAARDRCNELLDAIEALKAGCRTFRLLKSLTSSSCA